MFIVQKARFWKHWGSLLSERQSKVIAKMFDAGIEEYKAGMSTQKYMSITGCSKATATRDLQELREHGCIEPLSGSGKSTRYTLKLPERSQESVD